MSEVAIVLLILFWIFGSAFLGFGALIYDLANDDAMYDSSYTMTVLVVLLWPIYFAYKILGHIVLLPFTLRDRRRLNICDKMSRRYD